MRIGRDLRFLVLPIFIVLLLSVLLVGGTLSVLLFNLTDPGTVKSWLRDGDVYENAVDYGADAMIEAVTATSNQSINDSLASSPFGDIITPADLEQEAETILPPSWIQQQMETVIDAIYRFLRGETEQPRFTIDIGSRNDALQHVLGRIFKQKAASLPACTLSDYNQTELRNLANTTIEDINLLQVDCLPPQISGTEINHTIDTTVQNITFIEDTTINASMLDLNPAALDRAQTAYTAATYLPYAVLLLALVLTTLLALIAPGTATHKAEALTFGLAGLSLGTIGYLATTRINTVFALLFNQLPATPVQSTLETIARPPLEVAYTDLTTDIFLLAILLLTISIAFIVIPRLRHTHSEQEDDAEDEDHDPETGPDEETEHDTDQT